MSKRDKNIVLIVFLFVLMTFVASAENLINIFIPMFREQFSLDNTLVGTIVSMGSFAYLTFTFIGGILSEKFGQKKVFIGGIIVMIISLVMFRYVYDYTTLLINTAILNAGLSLVIIAINTLIPVLAIGGQAIIMTLTHFFYGVGSAGGQATGGVLYSHGVSWSGIYFILAVIFTVLLVATILIKIPRVEKKEDTKKISFKTMFTNKMVYLYILGLGFYVVSEMGTVRWLTNYIFDSYHLTESKSASYVTIFMVVFSIGRLFGGFIVEKLGYLNTVIKSLIIGATLYTLGLFFGQGGLYLIVLSGLFLSITFPVVLVSMGTVFKENATAITGTIVTCATTINMLAQILIGKLSDEVGTHYALFVIPACLFISIIFLSIIYKQSKKVSNGN